MLCDVCTKLGSSLTIDIVLFVSLQNVQAQKQLESSKKNLLKRAKFSLAAQQSNEERQKITAAAEQQEKKRQEYDAQAQWSKTR